MSADLSTLTVAALTALAKERGLRGYSGKRKAELVAMLSSDVPAPAPKASRAKTEKAKKPASEDKTHSAPKNEISSNILIQPDQLNVTKEHARFYWVGKEQILHHDNGGVYYYLHMKKPTLTFHDDKTTIVFNKKYKLVFSNNKADYELTKDLLNRNY